MSKNLRDIRAYMPTFLPPLASLFVSFTMTGSFLFKAVVESEHYSRYTVFSAK